MAPIKDKDKDGKLANRMRKSVDFTTGAQRVALNKNAKIKKLTAAALRQLPRAAFTNSAHAGHSDGAFIDGSDAQPKWGRTQDEIESQSFLMNNSSRISINSD